MPKPKVPNDYQNPYLHCRTFGHTWKVGPGDAEGLTFYRFILICSECGTRRIDVINRRTGGLAGYRRYEYPEGYQATRGEGLARTSYRIEFIRRITR